MILFLDDFYLQEVCGDHYLCHEKDSPGIKYSTGGAAMFRETLFAVCSGGYRRNSADDDAAISNHPDNFYESSKLISVVCVDLKSYDFVF